MTTARAARLPTSGSSDATRPRAEVVRQLVERSVGTQRLPVQVVDAATLRAVAIVMAHQPSKPKQRTSAASDRARSEMEDDRYRRPRAS